jgi:hypothetical protein
MTRRSAIIGSVRADSTIEAEVTPFSPAYMRSRLNARNSSSTSADTSAESRDISASSSPTIR